MAWTGHVVVAFPDPPSQGHIVDHWASELTSPGVNSWFNMNNSERTNRTKLGVLSQ